MELALADRGVAQDSPGSVAIVDIDAQPEPAWRPPCESTGCVAFLSNLGVYDALIAFTPAADEPRSIFVIGLGWLKGKPEQVRRMVRTAERAWRTLSLRSVVVIDFDPCQPDAGPTPCCDPLSTDAWQRALEAFGQAVVARQETAAGTVEMFLLRRRQIGRFDDTVVTTVQTALPLLFDFVRASFAAQRAERGSALITAMFDQMTLPTLVVDRNAKPIMVNRAAKELLDRRTMLLRAMNGSITALTQRSSRALRTAIAKSTEATHGRADGMHAVRLSDSGDEWLLAIVMPTRPRTGLGTEPAATIIIHEPQRGRTPSCILSALGLLPSEQRFIDAFLQTDSLGDAAKLCSLSQETARTYLKRVRTKLGAHRQMDLVRLIHGLVPPITPDCATEGMH